MQKEKIILIPPTHEQSVFSFHVEEDILEPFLAFLEERGIDPWRPPVRLNKEGPDDRQVIQIDVETDAASSELEALIEEFDAHAATEAQEE